MDDSPQHIPGEQQKPVAENTTTDQQYFSTTHLAEKRPNRCRVTAFVATSLIVNVVLILAEPIIKNRLPKRVVA